MKGTIQKWKLVILLDALLFLSNMTFAKDTINQYTEGNPIDTTAVSISDKTNIPDRLYVDSLSLKRHFIHRIGIEARPGYIFPTSSFFRGENLNWKPIENSLSLHLKYSFQFHPNTYNDRIYRGAYQGIGVGYYNMYAELQRMDAAKRHKEEQINLAEQELKQVKSEIRTDKLKKTATTAATAITSGVASLFGSGKLKELERANEKLQDEVSKRNTNIEKLQSQVQQMQKQHDTQIHNLREMHRQELDMKEKELSRLARIIDKAFRWFPMFREMLRMEKFCAMLGFSKEMTESLIVKKEALKCSGKIYSEQHRRNFDIKDDILRVENDPDDESRLNLTINRKPIADWFREQWHRLRYGARVPQQEERKSRGFKL